MRSERPSLYRKQLHAKKRHARGKDSLSWYLRSYRLTYFLTSAIPGSTPERWASDQGSGSRNAPYMVTAGSSKSGGSPEIRTYCGFCCGLSGGRHRRDAKNIQPRNRSRSFVLALPPADASATPCDRGSGRELRSPIGIRQGGTPVNDRSFH